MDEPVEDEETNRRRRRALVVFFAFVLMTAVGVGSLVLLLRGPEDVALARQDGGVDVPSGDATLSPTAALSVSTVATTVPSSSSTSFDVADLVGDDGPLGSDTIAGIQVAALDDDGPVGGDGDGSDSQGGPSDEDGSPGGSNGSGPTSTGTSGTGNVGPPPTTSSTSTSATGTGGTTATGGNPGTTTVASTSTGTSTSAPGPGEPFLMAVAVQKALYPGVVLPLDINFANPNTDPITLTRLVVTIDGSGPPGCPMGENFRVTPFQGEISEVVLPAGGRTSLRELGLEEADWPSLEMVETGKNQNACQGVTVKLTLSANARGGSS